MKLTRRITGAVLAGALALSAFVGPASANSIRISGNGSDSDNSIRFRSEHNVDIDQRNDADFDNNIRVRLNTGDNDASDNTGGDVRIRTGDADASVRVSNLANFNFANFDRHDFDHDGDNDEKRFDRNVVNNDHDQEDDKDHHEFVKHDDDFESFNHDGKEQDADEESDHPHSFHASLRGDNEVPGPGDKDGAGTFTSHANHEENKLCVELHVSDIEPATAAHIHYGEKGVAGPVVITLPTPDADGHASGCMGVNHDMLWGITQNPHDYYVNVHNAEYPDGAVRGQLSAD